MRCAFRWVASIISRRGVPGLARQLGENLVEHAKTAPAHEPVVDRLMGAEVPPLQWSILKYGFGRSDGAGATGDGAEPIASAAPSPVALLRTAANSAGVR